MTPERKEFLTDVIDTALSGGIGYWCELDGTRPDGTVVLFDEEEGRYYDLSLDVIEEGIARILAVTDWKYFDHYTDPVMSEKQVRFLRKSVADIVRFASEHDDTCPDHEDSPGDVDADVADVIVQVSLLGDVVYG